jgi:hypothetical protein
VHRFRCNAFYITQDRSWQQDSFLWVDERRIPVVSCKIFCKSSILLCNRLTNSPNG